MLKGLALVAAGGYGLNALNDFINGNDSPAIANTIEEPKDSQVSLARVATYSAIALLTFYIAAKFKVI